MIAMASIHPEVDPIIRRKAEQLVNLGYYAVMPTKGPREPQICHKVRDLDLRQFDYWAKSTARSAGISAGDAPPEPLWYDNVALHIALIRAGR